jgi:transcriptional regulator with XRE-family HTH domain
MFYCYTYVVTKDNLREWFRQKYFYWEQNIHQDRGSIKEFAAYLGIGRTYLTMLMNGTRQNISMETALRIAERLNDYQILSILGYARPGKQLIVDHFPLDFGERLTRATEEVNRTFAERGVTGEMPAAEKIAVEIFEKWGFKYISTNSEDEGS